MGNINIDCDSFCFSSLGFSFLGFCPRVMCALRPSPVRPFEFTCDCLRVCGSCCAQCWSLLLAYGICSGNPSPFLGGNPLVHGVIGVLPRPYDRLPTAQCIEGSRRSAVISLCRPLWRPLAAAVEGADSSASESVYLRRGGHPAERAGSGAWVGTPGPVDCPCLDERPPFQYLVNTNSRRVSSPRGVAQCLVPRKNPSGIFSLNIFITKLKQGT